MYAVLPDRMKKNDRYDKMSIVQNLSRYESNSYLSVGYSKCISVGEYFLLREIPLKDIYPFV